MMISNNHWMRQGLQLMRGRLPGQLVIQITDRCNASCPQCGMHKHADFPRSTLKTDELKRTIDHAAACGVEAISFTGGEPLMLIETVAELLRHAGAAGIPYLRTGSNGFFFRNPDEPGFLDRVKRVVDTLANTPLRNLWISLDSACPDTHERMRGLPGVVKGIEKGLSLFHDAGIYPAANLGVNRLLDGEKTNGITQEDYASREDYLGAFHCIFRQGLERFYERVIELGFTMSNTCYPMSVREHNGPVGLDAVYAATAEDRLVCFDVDEKAMLFRALLGAVQAYRSRLRLFSPCAALYSLCRFYEEGIQTKYPCRGGREFLFVSARDGNTYPCGYRGARNLGKYWQINPSRLDPTPQCVLCDWECFRDPSELAGPLCDALTRPWRFIATMNQDRRYAQLWMRDLRYFIACRFFDGRRSHEPERLAPFGKSALAFT